MLTIDRAQAIELLGQAVATKGPGYTYRQFSKRVPNEQGTPHLTGGCWYASETNRTASCGVGVALNLGGVPVSVLRDMDFVAGDTAINNPDILLTLEENGVTLTFEAVETFRRFQEAQDQEDTWGEALTNATKEN